MTLTRLPLPLPPAPPLSINLHLYPQRWAHVLVDEWQDINMPQYRLVQLLASNFEPSTPEPPAGAGTRVGGKEQSRPCAADAGEAPTCSSLFVVGDEDQRIYGWRGAVPDVVRSFASDFEACRVFTLEPNFRSTQVLSSWTRCWPCACRDGNTEEGEREGERGGKRDGEGGRQRVWIARQTHKGHSRKEDVEMGRGRDIECPDR